MRRATRRAACLVAVLALLAAAATFAQGGAGGGGAGGGGAGGAAGGAGGPGGFGGNGRGLGAESGLGNGGLGEYPEGLGPRIRYPDRHPDPLPVDIQDILRELGLPPLGSGSGGSGGGAVAGNPATGGAPQSPSGYAPVLGPQPDWMPAGPVDVYGNLSTKQLGRTCTVAASAPLPDICGGERAPLGFGSYATAIWTVTRTRPMRAVTASGICDEPADGDSALEALLDARKAVVAKLARSVGRVKLASDDGYVATAQLWKDDIVITNHHVAKELCKLDGALPAAPIAGTDPKILFKNRNSAPCAAADPAELAGASIKVISCLAADLKLDLAVLKLDSSPPGIMGVAASADYAATPSSQDPVVVIGYPRYRRQYVKSTTEYVADPVARYRQLYPGNTFDLRVSYGRAYPPPAAGLKFSHDATVYEGHSGSAVVSLDTGKLIGIHHSGVEDETHIARGYRGRRLNFMTTFKQVQSSAINAALE